MKNIDFNALAKEAFESAKERGFHDGKRADGHWLMLVVCELAEAVEADRRGRWVENREEYERLIRICDESIHAHLFEIHIKDTVEDELADAVIRLLDYAGMKDANVNRRLENLCDDEEDDEPVDKGNMSFVEKVFEVVQIFMLDGYVEYTILDIFRLAKGYHIDLMWHIREKMEYNKQRVFLHGKAY